MAKKSDHQLKKEIIDLQEKYHLLQHERRMKELEYIRETNKINHEQEMERGRIKTAEIRKAFERKQASMYPRGKWN